MTELELLQKQIADAQVGRSRLTDLAKGQYTLSVVADSKDPQKLNIALVSDKKVRTPISVNGLAAMRIAVSKDKVANILTTEDARDTDEITTFQNALAAEQIKLSSGISFEVIHRLRMKDTVNPDNKFIFKNNCYKSYPEYVKASGKAAAMPSVTKDEETARNNAFTEATNTLRASGVKPDVAIDDKHLSLIPVFSVK